MYGWGLITNLVRHWPPKKTTTSSLGEETADQPCVCLSHLEQINNFFREGQKQPQESAKNFYHTELQKYIDGNLAIDASLFLLFILMLMFPPQQPTTNPKRAVDRLWLIEHIEWSSADPGLPQIVYSDLSIASTLSASVSEVLMWAWGTRVTKLIILGDEALPASWSICSCVSQMVLLAPPGIDPHISVCHFTCWFFFFPNRSVVNLFYLASLMYVFHLI